LDDQVKQTKVYLNGIKDVYREKKIKDRAFITHAPFVEATFMAEEHKRRPHCPCQSRPNRVVRGILCKFGGRFSASYRPTPVDYPIVLADEEIEITVTEANKAYF
jgi:hypothetical protein